MILYTHKIDAKKINRCSSNILVYNRVKKLFSVLDKIILGKSINDLHILSKDGLYLLDKNVFEFKLRQINRDDNLFNKFQSIIYILLKSKYFHYENNIQEVITFITKSIIKYINGNRYLFFDVMNELPKLNIFDDLLDILWYKYNDYLVYFIVSYCVYPYLTEPIFDHKRVCTYCGKISNVTFIKCYGCRAFYYCSNICQSRDKKTHVKICPDIFTLIL